MLQPYVHDLACVLNAPIQVWSATNGQISPTGAQGIYCGDDRVFSSARLDVVSHESDSLGHSCAGSQGSFRWLLRTPEAGADPLVSMVRHREVDADGMSERITISSVAPQRQDVELRLVLGLDSTPIERVKAGVTPEANPPAPTAEELSWHWRDDLTLAQLHTNGHVSVQDSTITVTWSTSVDCGETVELSWGLSLADGDVPFVRPTSAALKRPHSQRLELDRLLAVSRADLDALRLAERATPEASFLAAGSPWYLTLFGRDSLISAMFLARHNPELALGTLRTLAGRQGTRVDAATAQAPGKILHEVRRTAMDLHDIEATVLPPEYYGTVDATLLWVMLFGLLAQSDPEAVVHLVPALINALTWLREYSDPDDDGLLEYFDESGHGLANQGWKDSGDSVRFADGRIAEGPIVLLEVQGYAYAAAQVAARWLPTFGRTAEERAQAGWWRDYADNMAQRVRERFWIEDELGPYLAIALDKDKQPVTGVASNMGHLIALGLLTPEEEGRVVERLMHPTMFSGYGIRTMSSTNGAYWPLRYHVGSVWTHDTAWIAGAMHRAGFAAEAREIAEGLLRVASGFNDRLPELFSGQAASEVFPPLPYPASCRPQAWAAASAYVLAEILSS